MNKVVTFLLSFTILLGISSFALAETISLPNPLCPASAVGTNRCIDSFPRLIGAVTTFISTTIGVLAVLIFMYAGILFLTSAGDPGKVEKAKDALKWGVIGIVVALAGNGLVAVVNAVIGAPPPAA